MPGQGAQQPYTGGMTAGVADGRVVGSCRHTCPLHLSLSFGVGKLEGCYSVFFAREERYCYHPCKCVEINLLIDVLKQAKDIVLGGVGGDKADIGQDEHALTRGAQTLQKRRVPVSVEALRGAAGHSEGGGDEPEEVTTAILRTGYVHTTS